MTIASITQTLDDHNFDKDKMNELMALTQGARLVRLYKATSFKSCGVSIVNGQTTYRTLTKLEFANLKSRLIMDGWRIKPMVTCWGYTARRPAEQAGQDAIPFEGEPMPPKAVTEADEYF